MDPKYSLYTDSKKRLWVLLNRWAKTDIQKKDIVESHQEDDGDVYARKRVEIVSAKPEFTTVELLDVYAQQTKELTAAEFLQYIEDKKLIKIEKPI